MTTPLPFTGNPLDRVSEKRPDPAFLAAALADPAARFLPLWQLKPLVMAEAAGWLPRARLDGVPQGTAIFLGLADGAPRFGIAVTGEDDPGPVLGGEFREMRAAAFTLPTADTAIAGQAKALIDWHRRHRFCPNCGTATNCADGGYRRLCPHCAAEHFPRTDPVVIMLPILEDHCLIGRNARFPIGGLYSAFAGFVEPGETMEEAVRRELWEEVRLPVDAVTYHASQPWPFASSLMLGCYARARARDFTIDGAEIVDARWLSKAEARARLAGGIDDDMKMPGTIAIAHRLMRDWALA